MLRSRKEVLLMVGVSALEVSHFPPSLFFLSGFFWREAASAEHR
jgi:hypothetical protein